MGYIVNPTDIPDLKVYQCDKDMAGYLLYVAKIPLLGFLRESEKPYLFALTDKLNSALGECEEYKASALGEEV